MQTLAPFPDFDSASREALAYLQERLGFGLWMTTRASGEGWVVLQARDHAYEIEEGDVLSWADALCTRMIEDHAPQIVTGGSHASTAITALDMSMDKLRVSAYVSVPIHRADGELFGTLCALDPEPQPPEVGEELGTVQMVARLLATLLESELLADERARELGATADMAMRDELTGALNRRGWRQRIEFEKERATVFGSPCCVLAIDLDGLKALNDRHGHAAGDELLGRAARCLREALRSSDALARMGGDEFSVLAADCDDAAAGRLHRIVREALEREGIAASIGMASARASREFADAMLDADKAMYADKLARRDAARRHEREANTECPARA